MADAQSVIGHVTLSSAQSSVVFSNIPQTYRDLYVTMQTGISSGGENVRMSLNSDTNGANYTLVTLSGNGSTATASLQTSEATYGLSRRTDSSSYAGTSLILSKTIWLFDYSSTNKHKTSLFRSGLATAGVDLGVTRWASNQAITSITFDMWSSTFLAGSTFTLYGVSE